MSAAPLDTFDIAKELGVDESVVCGMLVRPGELRTDSGQTESGEARP